MKICNSGGCVINIELFKVTTRPGLAGTVPGFLVSRVFLKALYVSDLNLLISFRFRSNENMTT